MMRQNASGYGLSIFFGHTHFLGLAITEALSRLDELGDAIDGTIDTQEMRSLIESLGGSG
jgi:hypothetical protein